MSFAYRCSGNDEQLLVPLYVQICDFGKSRVLGPQGILTTGSYATVTHMAPEVLARGELSRAGDVYSFGVLLWAMCSGARPWASMSHGQIVSTVLSGSPQLAWPASVPEALSALGRRCLAMAAGDRPSFSEAAGALEGVSKGYGRMDTGLSCDA